jgi:hypothetical protein
VRLPIDALRLDGGTQPRGLINYPVVEEYRDEMAAGASFPPVVVFYDGRDYWLADGFHRTSAAQEARQSEIECDVRQGTREDAVWFSCSANQGHGLRRSNADKRRAVETALRLRGGESDRAIAEHCGVSAQFTGDVRRQLSTADSSSGVKRIGRDGKTRTTTPAKQAAGGKASAQKREASRPIAEPVPDLTDFAPPPRAPSVRDRLLAAVLEMPAADVAWLCEQAMQSIGRAA